MQAPDFPDHAAIVGRKFEDVDGTGTDMSEWMAGVGAGLNDLTNAIIVDSADGHTYRLDSTNGVLTLVQVT